MKQVQGQAGQVQGHGNGRQLKLTGGAREAVAVRLQGQASLAAAAEEPLLRAPASGTPCVHWRLRVSEMMAPGVVLVHELFSPEPVELVLARPADAHARPDEVTRMPLPSESRLESPPVLYQPHTPGARAVATAFGFTGPLQVEELIVRADDELEVDAVWIPQAALASSPFRTIRTPDQLADVTVRVLARARKPSLLPWALGTAAALAGTAGVVSGWLRHGEAARGGRRAASFASAAARGAGEVPARLGPPAAERTRWP